MHLISDDEKLTTYKVLVVTAKKYGFIKSGKGRPSINELENYIYKNINKEEIQIKPKRKYSSNYYNELFCLAVCNGFVNDRAGKQKEKVLIDFLTSHDIPLPENQVVINQHRKKLSDCKTDYDKLLFQGKELGYSQSNMGLPSRHQLETYLGI